MGTFESWRRAYGALKDSTTVGLAKVGSDFKDIDIAIVKATNHDECPPKDLHVRRIMVATSFAVPRADVGYCIHTLSRRLTKTKNWIVAVKTLMVFHRILREGDPSFREELLNYSRRRHIFRIQEFRDDSSQLAWDCSSWIRTYATFLEERLECYRVVGFDIETERLTTAPGIGKAYGRTRLMDVDELLEQLPAMQQLLFRLIACQPEGAAYNNQLIQHAWALVLKESLKIYCVINDGIIRLVESFFEMEKDEAIAALNIYKRSNKQTEHLGEFYNLGKNLRLAMNIQFPALTQPPASFLTTMEEYVKGVCSNGSDSNKKPVHQEERSPRETIELATREIQEVENEAVLQDQEPEIQKVEEVVSPLISIDDDDRPGLEEANPKYVEIEDNDASRLALAVVQPGTTSSGWNETEKTSSWELALVTSQPNPNNTNSISQDKADGGFDKLLLYSLYEDDMSKKQMHPTVMSYNPSYQCGIQHESIHHHYTPPQQDHLMVSDGGFLPTTVPIVMMQQQQYTMNQMSYQQQCQNQYQQWYQHNHNMFLQYNCQQSSSHNAQPSMSTPRQNQFGDVTDHPQGNRGLM